MSEQLGVDKKFVVYSGAEEFPIANNIRVISLKKIMQKIHEGEKR